MSRKLPYTLLTAWLQLFRPAWWPNGVISAPARRDAMAGSANQDWRHAVAGCTAGLATVLTLHPLDVIKTRLQVQDGSNRLLPAYKGATDALQTMIRQEGWGALYAGLVPAVLGSGLSWSLYFCAYNNAKRRHKKRLTMDVLPAAYHLISAVEAGSLVRYACTPCFVHFRPGQSSPVPSSAKQGKSAGCKHSWPNMREQGHAHHLTDPSPPVLAVRHAPGLAIHLAAASPITGPRPQTSPNSGPLGSGHCAADGLHRCIAMLGMNGRYIIGVCP